VDAQHAVVARVARRRREAEDAESKRGRLFLFLCAEGYDVDVVVVAVAIVAALWASESELSPVLVIDEDVVVEAWMIAIVGGDLVRLVSLIVVMVKDVLWCRHNAGKEEERTGLLEKGLGEDAGDSCGVSH